MVIFSLIVKEIVLFDEQFQFHKSNAMNVLKESTNFLVVGILGKVGECLFLVREKKTLYLKQNKNINQRIMIGCGKSTLLSDLSGWDSSDFVSIIKQLRMFKNQKLNIFSIMSVCRMM